MRKEKKNKKAIFPYSYTLKLHLCSCNEISDVGKKQKCLRIIIYENIRLLLNIDIYATKLIFN